MLLLDLLIRDIDAQLITVAVCVLFPVLFICYANNIFNKSIGFLQKILSTYLFCICAQVLVIYFCLTEESIRNAVFLDFFTSFHYMWMPVTFTTLAIIGFRYSHLKLRQ
ncbi:hypothetical protein D0N36_07310 [Hymenobacter lapidiphilus]|nr:hypothetical protein D0N36_07310 [Hymenobacter sp. CCM 8763]